MKKLLFGSLLFAAVGFGFASCSDDDNDNEKPVISDFEPAEGDSLQIGKAVHLEVDLSDNEKLASYKIDIHNNFDNHGDHSASLKAMASDSVAFAYSNVFTDVAGQKNAHVHHHSINIPDADANGKPYKTGKYHFVIYCLDEAGNESVRSHNVILTYKEVSEHEEDDHEAE